MSPDVIRQELAAWIKAQREALPERREGWAHGAAETLHDLERELDRLFGPQNKNACSDCPSKHLPSEPCSKPCDEIDDLRHRWCKWCGELDKTGCHENGCRLGLGPDELDSVDYECPFCNRVAPWTDGRVASVGDERNEFWCQTCGVATPLEDCRVVPR